MQMGHEGEETVNNRHGRYFSRITTERMFRELPLYINLR